MNVIQHNARQWTDTSELTGLCSHALFPGIETRREICHSTQVRQHRKTRTPQRRIDDGPSISAAKGQNQHFHTPHARLHPPTCLFYRYSISLILYTILQPIYRCACTLDSPWSSAYSCRNLRNALKRFVNPLKMGHITMPPENSGISSFNRRTCGQHPIQLVRHGYLRQMEKRSKEETQSVGPSALKQIVSLVLRKAT